MRIKSISNNEPSFQARFANDVVTLKTLKAIKNDFLCSPTDINPESVNNLLQSFRKVGKFESYRLAREHDQLVMTSTEYNKYRNTEPIKDSLHESFMKLIGNFVNLKSNW